MFRKISSLVCFFTVLNFTFQAYAVDTRNETYNLGTLLDAVALNGTDLTFYVGPTLSGETNVVTRYRYLLLDFTYTYANTGTITATCTGGPTQALATATLTTCTVSSGTCNLNWGGVITTPSLTASKHWDVPLGIGGRPVIKCVMSHSGSPSASDILTVKGWLVSGN